jgi:MFS family permease
MGILLKSSAIPKLDSTLLSILLVSSVGILGAQLVSPVLPILMRSMSISEQSIGLVMSVFFFSALISIPIVGILADVYGRRKLTLIGLLIFGIAGTSIAFVDSFASLLILRAIQGIGFASLSPLSITIIGDLYKGSKGATAQGLRGSFHGISVLSIPPIAGFLADISWNYPFLLYSLSFPAAIIVFFFLPETFSVSNDQKIIPTFKNYLYTIKSEIFNSNFNVLFGWSFVGSLLKSSVITFIPLFIVFSLDQSAFIAGAALSFRGFVRIFSSPLSGFLVSYVSKPIAVKLTLILSAISVALIPFSTSILPIFFLIGIFGIGDSLFIPILNESVASSIPAKHRGGVVGAMNTSKPLGKVIGPILFGLILAYYGFTMLFLSAAFICFLYIFISHFFSQSSYS